MTEKTENPLVSVIVLNWNGQRFIDGFFASLHKQTYPSDRIEVLFVDNNSSDDSVEYFLQKQIPNARLIQTGGNYGYAGGNDFGLKEARGDYVAVCNNDLEFAPTWLEHLVATAQETRADVVVPKLIYADSGLINNAGSVLRPESDWPNLERGMDEPADTPEFNAREEVTAFCGASPLFARSFLQEVGIFDKHFFLYWEDVDLAWRGQKQNKTYIYEPRSVAYHHKSGSTGGEQSPVFIYYVSRNRVLILLKHGRWLLVGKAFAKVCRDHVFYKLRDCWGSLAKKSGRKQALRNLWLGVKIVVGIVALSPLMLAKRWRIIREETT